MNIESLHILNDEYPPNFCGAKVVQVIESKVAKGNGTEDNPNRVAIVYRSLDGKLLAVYDPFVKPGV